MRRGHESFSAFFGRQESFCAALVFDGRAHRFFHPYYFSYRHPAFIPMTQRGQESCAREVFLRVFVWPSAIHCNAMSELAGAVAGE